MDGIADALMLAAEKPSEPVALLCASRWPQDLPTLEELATVASRLHEVSTGLASVIVPAAWERDWTRERAELAANGRSLFRVFRRPYRAAIREFRGVCRAELPRTHDERVQTLDLLAEGRELRVRMKALVTQLAPELAEIAPSLPSTAERVARLVAWLKAAARLEPKLSVRNRRLLEWSDAPERWANQLRSLLVRVRDAVSDVCNFVSLTARDYPKNGSELLTSIGELTLRTQAWAQSVDRFNEWPPVREGLDKLASHTDVDFVRRLYGGAVQPVQLSPCIELAIMEQVWNAMREQDPSLETADGRLLDNEVSNFRALDSKWINAAAAEVARRHFNRKPTGHVGDMAVIRGEINKARRLLPVRKLIDQAGAGIQKLKPVFLMSPLSVAQYLAPGRVEFDLLLIDEASQVRPEDALGAIARAKQAIVVGDPKQLPPTNFFNRLVDDGDNDGDTEPESPGSPTVPLGAMESILSLCDATFSTNAMLAWHYRSHHPALIAVSNRNFYDNRLLLPPSPLVDRAGAGLGVVFNRTPSGTYDRGKSATNTAEADIVAEAVVAFAKSSPGKTLGVGTFSVAQRDAIRDRIEAKRRADPTIEPFFSLNRPEPFMIKNLESIQGDERDVIFISVGYGRGLDGRLVTSFGPINNDGGERRLNVLITRARERCEVFSSITADDIDIANRKQGVVALKEFLQFAEKGYFDIPQSNEKTFDSDFEESVAIFLRQHKFKVDPQVGMAGFFIDLGVRDPANDGRYLLGVECDGATYHSSRSARDRDRIRQQILELRGWQIHRIWSTDWFHRRAGEETRLLDVLARAGREPQSKKEPPPAVPAMPAATATGPANESADAAETHAPESGELYVEASFSVASKYEPHEAPEKTVHDAVRRIVEIEGPIHEEEVARRLATVWGRGRAGSRIRETALGALRSLCKLKALTHEKHFWSVNPPQEVRVRSRAEAASSTLRSAENLPPAEIVQAAREVLERNVRVPLEELIVEVARRLGFQRTGTDLHSAIRTAVKSRLTDWIQATPEGLVLVYRT
jgi:very-short-patch-repair endonuclease